MPRGYSPATKRKTYCLSGCQKDSRAQARISLVNREAGRTSIRLPSVRTGRIFLPRRSLPAALSRGVALSSSIRLPLLCRQSRGSLEECEWGNDRNLTDPNGGPFVGVGEVYLPPGHRCGNWQAGT